MPKKNILTGFHLRVWHEDGKLFTLPSGHGEEIDRQHAARLYRRMEEMQAQVLRHIDNIREMVIQDDMEAQCEFCGDKWGERSTTFNGGCCDKDLEHEPKDV